LEYDPNLAADSVELGSLGSFLSIPLRGGGRLLGKLEVYRRQPDSFREQDRQFFAEIGQRIGVALHHAERFQHAQALLNKGPAARTDGK